MGHDHKPMIGDTISLLKRQLENKGLSERDLTEKVNIEIVEIKEEENVKTQIEVPFEGKR